MVRKLLSGLKKPFFPHSTFKHTPLNVLSSLGAVLIAAAIANDGFNKYFYIILFMFGFNVVAILISYHGVPNSKKNDNN